MSVATCLGVDTHERPPLRWARTHWQDWARAHPALVVVSDLLDLPPWLGQATPEGRDEVLAALARAAAHDVEAVSVITWLLVPGAVNLARQLADLSPDIDALVAGQLWLTVRAYRGDPPRRVAATLLARTRREVMADLGVGEAAVRRDRVWASTVPMGSVPEVPLLDAGPEPVRELAELLEQAAATGALAREDRALLMDVAREAARLNVPARRGRGGLMTPSVAELVAEDYAASARTIRRRAAKAVAGLEAFRRSRQ
ncbi:hypothetical protein [Ornithinimicrobium sediminis]|uniref:hypothetical protein n=1 Tax=Ornithinimicrobium sediminis TaxID=2904603 RepID=UPI001E5D35D2|nr:hypothetical protein [Ornithinimicrobium sediminis]MCE0487819.1 hypothetical protein [Ornithinimicrobium sediminis]